MATSPTARLDAFQRRHRWAGYPVAVIYKFVDDQGSYLAALITYYAFVSLFPLLLLLTSVLGVVLRNDPVLQQRIVASALSQLPVIGGELGNPRELGGGVTAIVLGSLTALYGSLGVAQATQNALNQIWSVPRHRRPNPFLSRLRGLLLLLTAGLALLGATILSALSSAFRAFGHDLGWLASVFLVVGSVVVSTGVLLIAFRIGTAVRRPLREVLPGAVTAAVLWQLLQHFGAQYVQHVVADASATNSVSAVVLGLLAFLFLAANVLVFSVEINVVAAKHLYPRALLTPFTDNVDLTRSDQAVYTDAAQAQTQKGFEDVDVTFAHDGQYATARRREEQPPQE